ncbi:MAG TPA: LysM peptidoglycan-binding domain-containing protein [Anaerolineaceae bacterium]|jgi:hypothetical protein|nr:LysM peptidoglycan-binding domain-containing protein [Anaerolineaceae bacterium]HPS32125.1 LysM peptidoglycan-binding domain-containing protein [Anaerolineaceae bacterium]
MNSKEWDSTGLNAGQSGICPYLGLAEDSDSVQDYPSVNNACYHVSPPTTPTLSHQANCCLKAEYARCQVYTAEHNSKMPVELTIKETRPTRKPFRWLFLSLAAATVLFVCLFLLTNGRNSGQTAAPSPTATPTHTAVPFLLIRDATATPTRALALTPTSTPVPPTLTPTAQTTRAPHKLDMVIGRQDRFIIHRVSSGESIQLFATQNQTTPDVIKSVNYNLVVPIWVDSIIVIPLDRKDPGDLPAFEPFEIADKGLTLRDIAGQFNVDLDILARYNDLLPEDALEPGEWILIPRERTYWYRY